MPKILVFDMPDPYAQYEIVKREWFPQMRRRSIPPPTSFSEQYNNPLNFGLKDRDRDSLEYLGQAVDDVDENSKSADDSENISLADFDELFPIINFLNKLRLTPEEISSLLLPSNYNILRSLLNEFDKSESAYVTDIDSLRQSMENEQNDDTPERFSLIYNTPDSFRAGWESRDIQPIENDLPESRVYFDENDEDLQKQEDGSGERTEPEEIFRELKQLHEKYGYDVPEPDNNNNEPISELSEIYNKKVRPPAGLYTEGGVVYLPQTQTAGKIIYSAAIFLFNA